MLSSASGAARFTSEDLARLKRYLADNLLRALEMEGVPVAQRNSFVQQNIIHVYEQTQLKLPDDLRKQIFSQVLNDLLGYGPIQSLLDDEDVTEIMVNGPKKVFVEKKGQLAKSNVALTIMLCALGVLLHRWAAVWFCSPTVDAPCPDGSRERCRSPVAIDGPSITIRISQDKLKTEDLINYGSLTRQMAEFLEACVRARFNIVISGGTGSGKTTLLNVMSGFIPENERIITIEDCR
jgi:pilus assembly protein CpaF